MNELSTRARSLIEAANAAAGPSVADRARVRAALETKLAGLAAASPPAASLAGPLKVLAGASLVAVAGGLLLVAFPGTPPQRAPLPAELVVSTPAPHPAEAGAPLSLSLSPGERRLSAPALMAKRRRRAPPEKQVAAAIPEPVAPSPELAARAEPPPAQTCSLLEELEAVRAVQLSLSAGEAAQALRALDELAERCPAGALLEERHAARLIAMCELGSASTSSPEVKRFLQECGRSALLPRLLQACRE